MLYSKNWSCRSNNVSIQPHLTTPSFTDFKFIRYMSVSKQQQEIIDNVVSSFLKTNDTLAKQYLKLRQNVVNLSSKITSEITTSGKINAELLFELKKLDVESSQVSQAYDIYLTRLKDTLKYAETYKPLYLLKLEQQYVALTDAKDSFTTNIAIIRDQSKPIVEKMAKIVASFDKGISYKPGSRARGADILTGKSSNPNPDSTLIDYASTVFEKNTLEEMFVDVDKKLRQLRTVDEINDESSEAKSNEPAPSINIGKYLDETLQNNRAYLRLSDSKYSYDITRTTSVNVGSTSMSLDDCNTAIESLIKEIQGLVEGGALAKERWMSNARKLEVVQTVLQSLEETEMEVDG